MDWVLSVWVIVNNWIVGYKKWWVWWSFIGSTIAWIWYAIKIEQYGLIPASVILFFIAIRNMIKWYKEEKHENFGSRPE